MPQDQIQHFQEDGDSRRSLSPRLSDGEYGRALDHLVIACVDVVLKHQDQVLLAKRNQYPRCDWWLIGGRMQAGESPLAAVVRKVEQETNLGVLASDRFEYVSTYSTQFSQRKQPPPDNGLHSVNLTYQICLTTLEAEHLQLTPLEYETWQWLDPQQLEPMLLASNPRLNPLDQALLQVLQDSQTLGISACLNS